ncbi:MAG: cytochrome-c oxidase, cbb3-type subunit III [Gammaproteobacteria bacterium]|nr:cytochrome-c oxidase, cbb3-type subunit III [Gammaproteobacteria bacterium]
MTDKNPFPGEDNTGHIWDDNLRELNNPAPRWWMLGFWASVAYFFAYVILYPSIPLVTSYTKGVLGWTSIKEYQEGLAEVEAVRAEYEDKLKGMTAREILADAPLADYTVASAKVLFGDYCAPCHGGGGQGNPGYPVLADDDWLWGGSVEKIQETVTNGRGPKAVMPAPGMPAQASLLSTQEIENLATYLVGLSEGKDEPTGKALFMQKGCIGCHGINAKGMAMLGSANLTDGIWRFAPGGVESARHTIAHGVNAMNDPETRKAEMPSFKGRLDETAIKKLAIFVHKLGGGK